MTTTTNHDSNSKTYQGATPVKKNPPLTRLRDAITRDGGFTLIEILGVMVIVAILVGIAVVGVSKWREKAAITSMKADARNLALAIAKEDTVPDVIDPDGDPFHRLSDNNSLTAYAADTDTEAFSFEIRSSKTSKTICYSSVTGYPHACEGTASGGTGSGSDESTSGPTGRVYLEGNQIVFEVAGLAPGTSVDFVGAVGTTTMWHGSGTASADGIAQYRAALPPGVGGPFTANMHAFINDKRITASGSITAPPVPAIALEDGQIVLRLDGLQPGTPVAFRVFVLLSGQEMEAGMQYATADDRGLAEVRAGNPGIGVPYTVRYIALYGGQTVERSADIDPRN